MPARHTLQSEPRTPPNPEINLALNFRDGVELPALTQLEIDGLVRVTACLVARGSSELASSAFPEAEVHIVEELHARGASGTFEDADSRMLTPELLEGCQWAEPVALAMMDRIDVHRTMMYKQRLDLYHFLLAYWQQRILDGRISAFFSRETPHEVADFVLFVAMKHHGLPTPMFTWTSLPGRWIFSEDYRTPRIALHQETAPERLADTDRASALFDEIVSPLRSRYEDAQPEYMKAFAAAEAAKSSPSKPIALVRQSAATVQTAAHGTSRIVRSVGRLDAKGISETVSRVGSAWHTLEAGKRLDGSYAEFVTEFDPSADYVYYAMGYQPENTNCPEGGLFGDQLLAVSLLSECAPAGWRIVVKEHPNQLKNGGRGAGDYGFLGRQASMYSALSALENVDLVDTSTDQFKLIDNSRAVATLTGTVGWEAAARGVPVITLGHAWYVDAPNVWTVRSTPECHQAYEAIAAGKALHGCELDVALRVYLNEVDQAAQHIVFNEENARNHGVLFDPIENARKLEGLLRWYFAQRHDTVLPAN